MGLFNSISGAISGVGDFLGSSGGQALASVGSAFFEGQAAKDAAKTQAKASDKASQAIMDMYAQTRRDLTPWRTTGAGALSQYGKLYGVGDFGRPTTPEETAEAREGFVETPGYQFRFDEGVRALDRSASARGRLGSGGHERELTRYGQGIASDEFSNYANNLANLAGVGQTTAAQGGQIGQQAAGQAAGPTQAAGAARASGYVNQADAYTTGVENVLASLGRSGGAGGPGSPYDPIIWNQPYRTGGFNPGAPT